MRVCANASGFGECQLGFRLAGWSLRQPSEKQAEDVPALAAVREAFAPVPGAILGPEINDVCSDWIPVTLPLRGVPGKYRSGKLILQSAATTYDGVADKDKLRLTCVPASN